MAPKCKIHNQNTSGTVWNIYLNCHSGHYIVRIDICWHICIGFRYVETSQRRMKQTEYYIFIQTLSPQSITYSFRPCLHRVLHIHSDPVSTEYYIFTQTLSPQSITYSFRPCLHRVLHIHSDPVSTEYYIFTQTLSPQSITYSFRPCLHRVLHIHSDPVSTEYYIFTQTLSPQSVTGELFGWHDTTREHDHVWNVGMADMTQPGSMATCGMWVWLTWHNQAAWPRVECGYGWHDTTREHGHVWNVGLADMTQPGSMATCGMWVWLTWHNQGAWPRVECGMTFLALRLLL